MSGAHAGPRGDGKADSNMQRAALLKLFALLLAFKKLIIVGLLAAGGAIVNFFRGKSDQKVDLSK